MITIKQAQKFYGQKKSKKIVLNNINCEFHDSGIHAVIGANGAGKSSFFSLFEKENKFKLGEINIDGKSIEDYNSNQYAKTLSILAQQNHFTTRLTVYELVMMGRFVHHQGHPKQQDIDFINQMMQKMDVADFADSYLDELSGGQKQRVLIAMILAQDTKYILLDEPLNNLDMKHSRQLMEQLKHIANTMDKCIIIILHDINFASNYADWIMAIKEGEIYCHEKTQDVMRDEVLSEVFGMSLKVEQFQGKRICNYYA